MSDFVCEFQQTLGTSALWCREVSLLPCWRSTNTWMERTGTPWVPGSSDTGCSPFALEPHCRGEQKTAEVKKKQREGLSLVSGYLRKPTSFAQAGLLWVITHPQAAVKKGRRYCKPHLGNWGADTADREFDAVLSGPEISLAHLSWVQHLAPAFPL